MKCIASLVARFSASLSLIRALSKGVGRNSLIRCLEHPPDLMHPLLYGVRIKDEGVWVPRNALFMVR